MQRQHTPFAATRVTRRTLLAGVAGTMAGALLSPRAASAAASVTPMPRPAPKIGPLQLGTVAVIETGSLGAVEGIGWSPDSARLAAFANGGENTVLLYGADGHLGRTLMGATNFITTAAWSPDGALLATGCLDGTTRLWSPDGLPRGTVKGLGLVAWSPDGKSLATNVDARVRVWDTAGNLLASMPDRPETSAEVTSIAWSPDGTMLAVGTGVDSLLLFRADGSPIRAFSGHTDFVAALAWRPDGMMLASGSFDGTVRLWRTDGTQTATLRHKGQVDGVAWSPDGAALASDDGEARLWRADGTAVTSFGENSGHPVWSPDGSTLAVAKLDVVRLVSPDGTMLARLAGHTAPVESLAWAPDGKTLASGASDSTVRLWR